MQCLRTSSQSKLALAVDLSISMSAPTFRSIYDVSPAEKPSRDYQAELEKVYARMHEETLAFYKKILEQYRALSEDELAVSLTPPVSQTQIEEWREAGRIFSVPFEGKDLYPTFQFVNGQPKAVVGQVLKLLREERPPTEAETPYSDWNTMCWFVGANAWLDGQMPLEGGVPVEHMDSDPDAVVNAASHARDRISD
jgi:hypothetical protein